LSAAYAGVAGALFVHTIRVISPEVLELQVMVACLAMAVVGGRTRIAGAFVGAVLLIHLPEWFRFLDKYYLIAYGAVLLAMIIAAPEGLVGAFDRLRSKFSPVPLPAPPAAEKLPPRPVSPSTSANLLEIRHVSKSFGGVRALDDVSLEVRRGGILGLIGPNGSGKTTLVNVLTGLYTADQGEVSFAGRELLGARPFEIARRGVARSFQNLNLVGDLSALDNVAVARSAADGIGLRRALAASLDDPDLARARGQAMFLLDSLGVEAPMRPAGELAYGIKRRVEIARALALEPELLLLDEPAAGLNETEQADLAARLRTLAAGGCTLLVIEHNMPFLMPLADRIVCLDHGQIIAAGTPAEIRAHPRVIEAYLGRPDAVVA
jgi:branched-chain amino acid transport system permease protein